MVGSTWPPKTAVGQFEAASKANGKEQIKGKELGKGCGDFQVRADKYGNDPEKEKQNRWGEEVLQDQAGLHRGPTKQKSANLRP